MTASSTPTGIRSLKAVMVVCTAHGCTHDWVIWSGKPRCRKCGVTRR